jgi:glycosyltransferase involved in cell wall biosynthesis
MISSSDEKSGIPLVSIIVPAYNYGHLIEHTLNNLLLQTWQNWECIVVDDGSKDNTADVVKAFCNRDYRFIYHYKNNAGLSAARNTGIALAKGQFIQLLDADDLIATRKFELQLALFESKPEAEIVYSEVRYFRTSHPDERRFTMDENNVPWNLGLSSDNHEELACLLVQRNIMAVNCPLIKKEVFDEIGPFDISLKSVEDWEYWCRCAIKGKYFLFDPLEDSFALVRMHEGSMSTNLIKMVEASLIARENLRNLIAELPSSDFKIRISEAESKVNNYLHRLLYQRFKDAGQKLKAMKQLWKAYPIAKEYRFILKETIDLVIKK